MGDRRPEELPKQPFVIVYEMVGAAGLFNFPTDDQQSIIKKAEATVTNRKAWTNWSDDFELAKEDFIKAAESYDVGKEQIPRFKSEEKKLDAIIEKMKGDNKDKESIRLAFIMSVGLIGGNLNSLENIKGVVESKNFNNVADLADGLTFLKNKGISFTDLKTSNVMNVDGKLIIIDIGKSGVGSTPDIKAIGEDE